MSTNKSSLYDITGIRLQKGVCAVIVRTEWNAQSVDKLEDGCKRVLDENGVQYSILTVPGAFEIAFCIRSYWEAHKYKDDKPHAFIALACVIKGDTPHFEYVCKAVTEGVVHLNLVLPAPTIFGVLTVDNQQQIDERTGGSHGHKGEEAAVTALKLIALKNSFNTSG
jgi:6,7-dimethyl-8-ribityllumazine synthase